jgi:hypothetical protein
VARLSRELEALEEQRSRAREDAQRAETGRIQLEAEIKVGRAACPGIFIRARRSQKVTCAC